MMLFPRSPESDHIFMQGGPDIQSLPHRDTGVARKTQIEAVAKQITIFGI